MPGRTDSRELYRRIKARLVACDFAPQERLLPNALAEEYGVSRTPVRDVLTQLEAEGMVMRAKGRSYFPMPLSEERFRDLYLGNRTLLECAIEQRMEGWPPSAETAGDVTTMLNRLGQKELIEPQWLTLNTAELFALIAGRSDGDEAGVVKWIERNNDQLHYLRILECQRIDGVAEELMRMGELLLAEEYEVLKAAVGDYHDRRAARLASVLELWRG